MGLLSIPVKRYSRIPGLVLLVLGTGLAHPFAVSGAINSNATFTGAACGLYGFIQMAFGALCTALAAVGGNHLAMAMILVLLCAIYFQEISLCRVTFF